MPEFAFFGILGNKAWILGLLSSFTLVFHKHYFRIFLQVPGELAAGRVSACGVGGEGIDDCDVLEQVIGDVVTVHQVLRAAVGEPGFSCGVFTDEDFQGKVDSNAGSGEHQRRSSFGAAEDEQLGGRHGQSDFCGFAAVIDQREEGGTFRFEKGFQFAHGFVDGVVAGDFDDSVVGRECHGCLLYGVGMGRGRFSNRYEIDRHCQPNGSEEECDGHCLRGVGARGFSAIDLADQADVTPSCECGDDDSNGDERGAKPEREAVGLDR